MAEDRSVMTQVNTVWGRVPALARLGIVVVGVAFVGWFLWGLVGDVIQRWEPLASGLPGAEQARVLDYLRDEGVAYRIEGGAIMVPADRAAELKIEMSGQDMQVGLLRGLERLESVGMGDTEKTIHTKLQLALQEELQKALNALPMVEASQVKLALPEERGFLSASKEPAKASVWLIMRPGMRFSSEQVHGLQVQIAHSITNLQPENVSILDHNSDLLSQRPGEDSTLAQAQGREVKRIKDAVISLLEQAIDPSRIRVSANVELNRVSREETRRDIDTTNPAETYFESLEEEESGGAGAGGVPGTETNTGEAVAGAGAGAGSATRSRTEEKRSTDYSTVVTKTEYKSGEIKRQSVAVLIDLRRTETEEGQEEYVSWGNEKLRGWEQSLRNAVGINEQRGDSLTLNETSFEHLHQMAEDLKEDRLVQQQERLYNIFDWSDWTSVFKIPIVLLAGFLILWFVVRPVGKRMFAPILALPGRTARVIPEHLPKTVEEMEAELESKLEEELDLPGREIKKGVVLKKRLLELAKNEPENFTQLIRSWLYE